RTNSVFFFFFFFSSRRRHTRSKRDWSSDVCSSDLGNGGRSLGPLGRARAEAPASVAAVLGRQHQLALRIVVIALRPPVIGTALRSEERRVGKEHRARRGRARRKKRV